MTQSFCKYIVQNYDALNLKCRTHDPPAIWNQKQMDEYNE